MKTSLSRSLILAAGLAVGGLTASAAETPNMAVVLQVSGGSATALQPGASSPRSLQNGDKLPQGTTITTGPGATVQLQPFAGAVSVINQNSTVSLDNLTQEVNGAGNVTVQHARLNLKSGNVVSMLDPTTKSSHDYGVITPKGVASANGSSFTTDISPLAQTSFLGNATRQNVTYTLGSGTGTSKLTLKNNALSYRSGSTPRFVQALSNDNAVTISANAEAVVFTSSDGSTYTIANGQVSVTAAGSSTPQVFALTALANNSSAAAVKALAAIQSGVTAMVTVLSTPAASLSITGSGSANGLAALAGQIIAISNVANPSGAAANSGAIVAAVSTSPGIAAGTGGTNAAVASVMAAAVGAAPSSSAGSITSYVASAVVTANSSSTTNTTTALQAVTQGADVGVGGASASASTLASLAATVAGVSPSNAGAILAATNSVNPSAASVVTNALSQVSGVTQAAINNAPAPISNAPATPAVLVVIVSSTPPPSVITPVIVVNVPVSPH